MASKRRGGSLKLCQSFEAGKQGAAQ